jgi:ATP/maltotriose-dependent transcriptional regulator MalT
MASDREWPLVGRSGEFRWFERLLHTAPTRAVVLAGPAGVGKTRLAREWLHLAERAGMASARVTATRSAAGLPFGAMAPILPAAHHGETGQFDDRADLLRRAAQQLVDHFGTRRLALLVDDAHLLDDASATLVHQLAATGSAFVMVTVRTGEPTPDPVTALWKDELAVRLDLRGLTSDAIDELLGCVLDGPVDPALVSYLGVRCQGNVLFLRELVLGALEDGTIGNDTGIWRLTGKLRPSERLVELVEARLEGLEPEARAQLEVLSYSEPIGAAELARVGDPQLAEALERRGLVASGLSGRRLEFRLAHPLYGDVLRGQIPAVRAREIARALAEAIEEQGVRRREDTLRVAIWRLDSGGAQADLMLAAATTARWRYDFVLAERLALAAVEVGAGFRAELLAAQLASLQGRAHDAEERMAKLQLAAAADDDRTQLALSRLDNLLFSLGDTVEGLRVSNEAEQAVSDPARRDEISARRTGLILATCGPRVAIEAAEPLLARAQGRALVWACFVASFAYGRMGRTAEALAASTRGYDVQLSLPGLMDWYPWFHLWIRSQALLVAGRFTEANRVALVEYDLALDEGSQESQAFFAWHLTSTVGELGNVGPAIRHGREAATLFDQLGRRLFATSAKADLAKALALAGQATEAAETLDSLPDDPPLWTGAEPLVARGWTAAARGDLPEARRFFIEAADVGERIGDLAGATSALHALARLGSADQVAARLGSLAAVMEGPLPAARVAHTNALAARDPGALVASSDAFETTGAPLLAAEAAADAAVAWRRRGEPRAAAAAEHRLGQLLEQCPGVRTPGLQSVTTRARLTSAERETAVLAAQGHSDKEIAETLCLSVRTIENRLQRVYEKLGIAGRRELRDAL